MTTTFVRVLVTRIPLLSVAVGGLLLVQPSGRAEPAEIESLEAETLELETLEAEAATPSPWRSTVELYGFAPLRTTGTTRVRGFEADVDLDLGDVLSALDWATYVRGSVERDRWGLLTDLSYVRLGASGARTGPGDRLTGKAEVSSSLGIYDLAVRYRFGEPEAAVAEKGSFSLIPYAGVRVIAADLDVDAQVQGTGPLGVMFEREGSFGRTWAQPLVGLQGSVFLTPRLRAFARADIGGFGLSGDQDLSGNAQVGVGYAIGNNTNLNLSWRYLGVKYRNDRNPSSGFSNYQNGIELGLKFFF
ncbi:hypothetical protein KBY96_02195 [Cyanobium sp. ATX 6A2]|uniref:hypothetical protein n=1 Tax=Cyanobium sp. ATX 6A2 TaxID=2823700 RepID=UPI0020CD3B85|nr:hypothetical protein [Cyanobium sp. ATX 6A2]MCP9886749.1 hypothetical protein [Cyanobium sp. ATX 6A2]